MRVDYRSVFPAAVTAMAGLEEAVHASSLDAELLELVKLRASQLNGCGYCVDMHTKDAKAADRARPPSITNGATHTRCSTTQTICFPASGPTD